MAKPKKIKVRHTETGVEAEVKEPQAKRLYKRGWTVVDDGSEEAADDVAPDAEVVVQEDDTTTDQER